MSNVGTVALVGPVNSAGLREWLGPVKDPALLSNVGGGTPVTTLARGLLNAGLTVVCVGLDTAAKQPITLEGPRLRVHVGPDRPGGRARDVFRAERQFIEAALRSEEFDLIHAHWTYEYALAARRLRRPTVVTAHDWAPTILRLLPDMHRAVRLGMSLRVLTSTQNLTAPSPYLRDRLQFWLRRPVTLVPNGLDDDRFAAQPRAAANLEAPKVLAVNHGFAGWKNVSTLLEAFGRFRTRMPDASLILAGMDYELGGKAHTWARERGLEESVRFAGPQDQAGVLQLMQEADLLAHPSLEESFGLVLVEAMAQGIPVVAGRTSGAVPWVLDGGRAGLLADVTDAAALSEALWTALNDPGRWSALAMAGYGRASTAFRMSALIPRWLDCYDAVASAT